MTNDLPNVEFYTYHSNNAPRDRAWVAYIWTEDAGLWNIHFSASQEDDAKQKASDFYEERRAKREAAILNRIEGRKKAEATRRRKEKEKAA